ncbi:hypothetical protein I656_03197 [Geobacillus sp. WSUCF1]|nr:hypothetical protein I656_03197 [Geobacillus sp. WSUCF1]
MMKMARFSCFKKEAVFSMSKFESGKRWVQRE